jgi:hypothetical protein
MNHSENTPGYSVRLQLVFTLKDGTSRAWILSNLGGQAVLVGVPFDQAKRWVASDQADELSGLAVDEQTYGRPVPLSSIEAAGNLEQAFSGGKKPGCGCDGKVAVDVAVVGTQRTEVAFAGRGRLLTGNTASEPLFAVAEPGGDQVACCGPACEGAGTPNAVVFDRFAASEGGGYAIKESIETPFSKELTGAYASRTPQCLPWVRIARDPERFRSCLAAAKAIGPMTGPKSVCKLVGEYMMSQDQEVFLAILIDSQLMVRGISEIARGARDKVDVPVPDVLRIAVVEGASAIIVVHNHPSTVCKPSDSDKLLTETIRDASQTVNLELMDHVIICTKTKFYSFAEAGKLKLRGYKQKKR